MSKADEQWGARLKQARLASGLSQKQLGIKAGLDESVASTRVNRYEVGVHKPDFATAQRLAAVLQVTAAFLYAPEDDVANLLFRYGAATKAHRSAAHEALKSYPLPPCLDGNSV